MSKHKQLAKHVKSATVAGALLLVLGAGARASTDRTWGGGTNVSLTSGIHSWNIAGNWSGDDVPDTGTAGGEIAFIGDTSADRTITTPNTPLTTYGLDWTQSASSIGVNKLVLGGDMTVDGYTGYPNAGLARISNSTGSPANMVLDLNGRTLDLSQWIYLTLDNMTLINSGAGGRIRFRMLTGTGANLVTGPGVVFESPIAEGLFFGYTSEYHPESLMLLSAVGTYNTTYGSFSSHLGKLQVGQASNVALTRLELSPYGYVMQVRGSVELFVPPGDTGQVLDLQACPFYVGGDFIDHGPVNGAGYGDGNNAGYPTQRYGKIVFNNSPVTPSIISIPRNTLTNDFFVGNPAVGADTGNVVLAHDLTTTALIAVSANSKLDVADKIATAGTFTAASGSKFGLTFGDNSGAIHVTGDLTLSSFSLDLTWAGDDWADGTDLILFTYGGNLIGTPTLTTLNVYNVPPQFRYDGLVFGDGVVMLSNVTVPEPASVGLLALGGALLLRRRSR